MIIRILVIISFSIILHPIYSENRSQLQKLEECLSEFYQGRPRDYPPKAEKKKILVFKSHNGTEYLHMQELRGMEEVCYKLYSPKTEK